ncbi:MAG: molybdopterin-guanine dinucleotide biosynthesis protein B [Gammaproteobacteria bacterium]|nr:molybdopterin-guanine dinucleotide biosynthesis protein B [Gammaproteobacteria bacterium]
MNSFPLPIVGFCAYSGTGKTTLLTKLVPLLKAEGLRVAVLKHAHHAFDIDHWGKDSYRLRKSGANQMLVASRNRMALIEEFSDQSTEPRLDDLLPALNTNILDLVLVEGFKQESIPKIELHRKALKMPLIYPNDTDIIAIATDHPLQQPASHLSTLDINNIADITTFIINRIVGRRPKYSNSDLI